MLYEVITLEYAPATTFVEQIVHLACGNLLDRLRRFYSRQFSRNASDFPCHAPVEDHLSLEYALDVLAGLVERNVLYP